MSSMFLSALLHVEKDSKRDPSNVALKMVTATVPTNHPRSGNVNMCNVLDGGLESGVR